MAAQSKRTLDSEASPRGSRAGPRVWLARAALVAWFLGVLVVGAGLLARHLVALPAPPSDPRFASAMNGLRSSPGDRWLAVHVLYGECRCSHRIAAHLAETARPTGWEEVVLWAGTSEPPAALRRGFEVRRVSRAELARWGVEAAPLLAVLDPGGGVRYAGGYTERKQGPVVDDARIFAAAQKSHLVAALPVLGCAISERLERAFSRLPSLSGWTDA